VLAKCV